MRYHDLGYPVEPSLPILLELLVPIAERAERDGYRMPHPWTSVRPIGKRHDLNARTEAVFHGTWSVSGHVVCPLTPTHDHHGTCSDRPYAEQLVRRARPLRVASEQCPDFKVVYLFDLAQDGYGYAVSRYRPSQSGATRRSRRSTSLLSTSLSPTHSSDGGCSQPPSSTLPATIRASHVHARRRVNPWTCRHARERMPRRLRVLLSASFAVSLCCSPRVRHDDWLLCRAWSSAGSQALAPSLHRRGPRHRRGGRDHAAVSLSWLVVVSTLMHGSR